MIQNQISLVILVILPRPQKPPLMPLFGRPTRSSATAAQTRWELQLPRNDVTQRALEEVLGGWGQRIPLAGPLHQ